MAVKITEQLILNLLRLRHRQDIFYGHCRIGPSYSCDRYPGAAGVAMDAMAIPKSWSNMFIRGYEIKTSRGDFLRDNKWHNYLQSCTEFYFVSPKGVVKETELPDKIGLIEVAASGTGLRTVRKAAKLNDHSFTQLEATLLYILMSRVAADLGSNEVPSDIKLQYFMGYLSGKRDRKQIGHLLSKSLARDFDTQVDQVIIKQKKLDSKIKTLSDVDAYLTSIGYWWRDSADDAIKAVNQHLNEPLHDLISRMHELRSDIDSVIKEYSNLTKEHENGRVNGSGQGRSDSQDNSDSKSS